MSTKNKRIFIEALALVDGHFSGIGQYVLGILKGIDELIDEAILTGEVQPDVYVVIPYDTVHAFRKFGFRHIKYRLVPIPFRIMSGLWHRNKMPPLDLFCGKGIYLFTRFADMRLLSPKNKSALVIYDISYEIHREYSDEGNARFLSDAVKRSLRRASKIVTISQNAKREIVEFYGVNKSSVCVATPATDASMFYRRSQTEIAKAKQKYGISGEYILALSNLEPRKNLGTLVEAYCNLPKQYRDNLSLVLVGVSGWKTDKLFGDILARVEQGYDIIRPTSYVLDEDKPAILSGAKMLVYPSHYEGFGMPPLEALACGTPVIVANNSSLPEAVGKNGEMLDSHNTEGFMKAIKKYFDGYEDVAKTAQREGPKHAATFSWKASAQTILAHLGDID